MNFKKSIKPFTKEEISELFYIDPNSPSGLAWSINYRHHKKGSFAGYKCKRGITDNCGMVWHVCFNGRPHLVHRIVWVLRNDCIPKGFEIDHIDGETLNNKITNLSLKTRAHNTRARVKMNSRNTSGFTGVRWNNQRNKWQGRCFRDYREYHCGFHDSKEDAAKSVDVFAAKWAEDHGEEFRLANFKN